MNSSTKEHDTPYSIFGHYDRIVLSVILSLIGMWSSISGTIHIPALPTLEKYFHIGSAEINISVVTYSIFQGITPTFTSTLADVFGRRPVLLLSIICYTAVCIAISQIKAFWLLLFLRCLQAASIAPVIAIASGVSGDICTPANRGGFVGVVTGTLLVGNGFGGLIGAALLQRFGWRGIFEFLAIGSGVTFVLVFFILPETHRSIAGNGSVTPKHFVHRSPYIKLPNFQRKMNQDKSTLRPNVPLNFAEPFYILIDRKVVSVLLPVGLHYSSWYMALTSISTMEKPPYNYSIIQVGLVYLPQGIFCLIGPFLTGYLLNVYYRRCRAQYDKKYHSVPKSERPPFNIFMTRIAVCVPLALIVVMGLLIFGWCLHYHMSVVSIIISSILISFAASSFQSAATTLLVDLYPGKSSSSASCINLFRGLLTALFVGVLDKMTSAMGLGGCYTFMAALCLLSNLSLVLMAMSLSKPLKHPTPTTHLTDTESITATSQ
ncbi:MFS antiporter QDR2 [Meyerozyma sp. JA9]|nr:MFS antiporter QDR2 [Meyerozyma sp. JA9]